MRPFGQTAPGLVVPKLVEPTNGSTYRVTLSGISSPATDRPAGARKRREANSFSFIQCGLKNKSAGLQDIGLLGENDDFRNVAESQSGNGIRTSIVYGYAAGMRIIASQRIDRKAILVIALSFSFGLSVEMVPNILSQFPETLRNLFASGITTGGLTAIVANALIRIDEYKDNKSEEI